VWASRPGAIDLSRGMGEAGAMNSPGKQPAGQQGHARAGARARTRAIAAALLLLTAPAFLSGPARAQAPVFGPGGPGAPPFGATAVPPNFDAPAQAAAPPSDEAADGSGVLNLTAVFAGDNRRVGAGLVWNVFREGADGAGALVAQSNEAAPIFVLPAGDYVVHVGYGLAAAVRRVSVANGKPTSDRVPLNAGGLRLIGTMGDARIPPERISAAIYVPEGANPQGKLVARDVRPGQLVRLPEGVYHIISTYLEAPPAGIAPAPTNSVVEADVRIQSGRTTETTLRHRAAQITLKLVNVAGGEALANTSFTVLTPGGDVLREMIGAFPTLILAEGEYVAIARRDGRTYQSTFAVRTGRDRDVEILAREAVRE
jgi:hypothetical protein